MATTADALVGKIKTFGSFGPKYEILEKLREIKNDYILKIRLIESGDETEYPASKAERDPEAH